jgi:hypothetical protein
MTEPERTIRQHAAAARAKRIVAGLTELAECLRQLGDVVAVSGPVIVDALRAIRAADDDDRTSDDDGKQ